MYGSGFFPRKMGSHGGIASEITWSGWPGQQSVRCRCLEFTFHYLAVKHGLEFLTISSLHSTSRSVRRGHWRGIAGRTTPGFRCCLYFFLAPAVWGTWGDIQGSPALATCPGGQSLNNLAALTRHRLPTRTPCIPDFIPTPAPQLLLHTANQLEVTYTWQGCLLLVQRLWTSSCPSNSANFSTSKLRLQLYLLQWGVNPSQV